MYQGEIKHFKTKTAFRRLDAEERKKVETIIKDRTSLGAKEEMDTNADMAAVELGKRTTLRSLKTYQNIKFKVDEDIILYLCKICCNLVI